MPTTRPPCERSLDDTFLAELERLWQEGHPAKTIERRLGRSIHRGRERLIGEGRIKPRRRGRQPIAEAQIIALAHEGYGASEIAEQVHLSVPAVKKRIASLRAAGVPMPERRWRSKAPLSRDLLIAACWRADFPADQIADIVGLAGPGSVKQAARRLRNAGWNLPLRAGGKRRPKYYVANWPLRERFERLAKVTPIGEKPFTAHDLAVMCGYGSSEKPDGTYVKALLGLVEREGRLRESILLVDALKLGLAMEMDPHEIEAHEVLPPLDGRLRIPRPQLVAAAA